MNSKILFPVFLILFLLQYLTSGAAQVKITGKAIEYANQTIELNRLHDFISEEKIRLETLRFNAQGQFSTEFDLEEITLCFADFDGYHGMIYLEPGKTYELLFPPKQQLTEAQKRNPFVKPDVVWFGVANPDKNELNYLIQQFEQAYLKYENTYFDQIFINQNNALVDTVKQKLSKEFPQTGISFFEAHKQFRKANLEFALHQGKSAGFMETYFSSTRPAYNLAAYSTLFNQVFSNYFTILTNSPSGEAVKKMIISSNLQQLDDYFQEKLKFNKALSHLILLKSLKDAYYSKQFQKASVLKMLDMVDNAGWSSYEQKTTQLIRSKLTYLASGTFPPTLILKNLNGQKINLSDYRNSYVYLHFTDPKNTICRQHLDALKTIAGHYPGKLVVVNVILDQSSFKNENGWAGIFTTTESNLEETYKVKTFPNSFLIGKDGKLLLSPAPNPIDGLDRQLGQIFKNDYFREMQKQGNPQAK